MARVQVRRDADSGTVQLLVDGHDLSNAVLTEGFVIVPYGAGTTRFLVRLTVRADELDADLPDSVIEALRSDVEENA